MNQTQCCALKFLCFEGATIQTRNEVTDWFVCGAVNHSAGSFGERSSCCFARNMSRDFFVPKQPSKQWVYGLCSLKYEVRSRELITLTLNALLHTRACTSG